MNKDLEKGRSQMKEYLEYLKQLAQDDPEAAKELARESLIKTGVLNEDGTAKEHIVEDSYIGSDTEPMSYEDIVATMKTCIEGIRQLGEGDSKKTHSIAVQALLDSGFISRNGHVIIREKRSPQVEAFFKRVESEIAASKQRTRK